MPELDLFTEWWLRLPDAWFWFIVALHLLDSFRAAFWAACPLSMMATLQFLMRFDEASARQARRRERERRELSERT